ncbi:MAG TPA: hypothetical protein VHG28_19310 [Longimicrobiaceae bacterium]|nr:hypothetical protein [Longimicrobiaceae bacterium]
MSDPSRYPIVVVPPEAAEQVEQMGSKSKFWYTDERRGLCLFKYTRPGTGEDWAEKIAEELCALLDLPHAYYELAVCGGACGVITESFLAAGERLVPGNELLVEADPAYPALARGAKIRVTQHTLEAIADVLSDDRVRLPLGFSWPAGVESAWDVFVGYLLLDALIGNTDRHHENWALIEQTGPGSAPVRWLAPTHDHGSSLGRNVPDARREYQLTTKDLNDTPEAYASRAPSKLYLPGRSKALSTFEAFAEAARMSPHAAEAWIKRLAEVKMDRVDNFFWRVPEDRISRWAVQFAQRILHFNHSRLLGLL